MLVNTVINGENLSFDTSAAIDITIPIIAGMETVSAYYIPFATISPIKVGNFVGSVALGGSVNCENITLNAHGNGTHTECLGHISKERVALHNCLKEFLFTAELISVYPTKMPDGDLVITRETIEQFIQHEAETLIIRTLPNGEEKKKRHYSGTNPTYLAAEAALLIRERGYKNLVVDIPSVDREEDAGVLAAHHIFWNYPDNPRYEATISELVYVPDSVKDGQYMVNILASAMDSDACPSRIVLYPFK